jgi:hypothetical protein
LGGFSLIASHLSKVINNGEVTKVPLFPMNKIKRDSMHQIIDKYIKRDIMEASTLPSNSLASLVQKQHRP